MQLILDSVSPLAQRLVDELEGHFVLSQHLALEDLWLERGVALARHEQTARCFLIFCHTERQRVGSHKDCHARRPTGER